MIGRAHGDPDETRGPCVYESVYESSAGECLDPLFSLVAPPALPLEWKSLIVLLCCIVCALAPVFRIVIMLSTPVLDWKFPLGCPQGIFIMRVRINCGGRLFETTEETLRSVPGSFFCGDWESFAEGSGEVKEIFLDHDPEAFAVVLDYLRYRTYNYSSPTWRQHSSQALAKAIPLADYLLLHELRDDLQGDCDWQSLRGNPNLTDAAKLMGMLEEMRLNKEAVIALVHTYMVEPAYFPEPIFQFSLFLLIKFAHHWGVQSIDTATVTFSFFDWLSTSNKIEKLSLKERYIYSDSLRYQHPTSSTWSEMMQHGFSFTSSGSITSYSIAVYDLLRLIERPFTCFKTVWSNNSRAPPSYAKQGEDPEAVYFAVWYEQFSGPYQLTVRARQRNWISSQNRPSYCQYLV